MLPTVLIVLLVLSLIGALRIDFQEDVFALLPHDEAVVSEAQLAMQDRKSTRLNSSHTATTRMPSSA